MRYLIIMLACCVVCFSCAPAAAGRAVPGDKAQELAGILERPSDFTNKALVYEGVYIPTCAKSCCDDFYLKKGTAQVKVFPQGFSMPKLKAGKVVRVFGTLTETKESPFVSALGIQELQ